MENDTQNTFNPNQAAGQANPEQAAQQGQLRINKLYVKDISVETPNSPSIFMTHVQSQPHVDFRINTGTSTIQENLHEVVLSVTVTVKMDNTIAFLVEVQQAGLFQISGFPQQQLHYLLGSYCPNLLFPFAREAVSDLVTRGGFPPLLLEPVNFDALYAQQMQRLREQQQAGGEQAPAADEAPAAS